MLIERRRLSSWCRRSMGSNVSELMFATLLGQPAPQVGHERRPVDGVSRRYDVVVDPFPDGGGAEPHQLVPRASRTAASR